MTGNVLHLSKEEDDNDDRDENDDAGDDAHLDGFRVEGDDVGQLSEGVARVGVLHSIPACIPANQESAQKNQIHDGSKQFIISQGDILYCKCICQYTSQLLMML
jgi:hypothetical protein